METNYQDSHEPRVVAQVPTSPTTSATVAANGRAKQGHAKPLIVTIELSQPGRLRVGHLMSLLSISHATLYARWREGKIPKPDGMDGRRPFWKTSTIKAFLDT